MKKYDIIFQSNRVRYIERIEASTKESAKNKLLKKYNDIEKITRIKEAEDFVCYTYKQYKMKDGKYEYKKEYYGGCFKMPFGYSTIYHQEKENAKRFMIEQELKEELKMLNKQLNQFEIEKVKA
jgi:hypothetical protein